ncbi:MAG TPA: response regulator [Pirellulales bacterium]|jgi:CheY-like chemotaxis protein|nr:response regulator [Pirellulales bacterium]
MPHSILLCDDDIAILRAAEFKLSRAGYDVRCAHDGLEGWQELERRCPNLLITDFQMPRLDGFGLCRKVRGNPPTAHLPILMLTAKGFELLLAQAVADCGVIAVIAKPFSPRELLQTVQRVLGDEGTYGALPAIAAMPVEKLQPIRPPR